MTSVKHIQPRSRLLRVRSWLFVLIVIVVIWATPWGVSVLATHYSARQEQQQQLLSAHSWLVFAERCGAKSPGYWCQRARLSRKLSNGPDFTKALQQARLVDAPVEPLQTELMLAEAQRGDLSEINHRISALLLDASYPGDEVCNAYVEGCLIKYRLDDAVAILDVWEQDYPADPRPNFLRGRIREHRTDIPGAQAEYSLAIQKAPRYAAPLYNMARTQLTEQHPDKALPFYETVARQSDCPVPGLVGMAQCQRLLRRLEEAAATLNQADAVPPETRSAMFRLVGESTQSGDVELLAEKGRLLADQGDHAGAVRSLKAALSQEPLGWRIRYQLALSQRQAGQTLEAMENLQRVEASKAALATCDRLFDDLRKDPDNLDARLQIGRVFLQHFSINQGIVWLNSVLDRDPGHPEANRLLAEYYESLAGEQPEMVPLAERHRKQIRP